MNYVIRIKYKHAEIGCNPGPIEIKVGESKEGILNLAAHLQKLFGQENVEVWEDVTRETYKVVKLRNRVEDDCRAT